MEKEMATLGKGVQCCSWNYCGKRLAVGYNDGSAAVHDSLSSSSTFSRSSKWTVHVSSIKNIIWIPPDFGDAIACICVDGTLSLWEEAGEDAHSVTWKKCVVFGRSGPRVLEVQFGFPTKYLKMVSMWEFEEPHQRWLPVAELSLPEDRDDRVHALAWAPNIGRPFEVIAVGTYKGIAIWHVWLESETDHRFSSEKIVLLSGHVGEIWQLEWDISCMTLVSTGDSMVRLWQSNLNGVWHEHATLDCGGGKQ
ncbi:hypothetical protein KSP40_PGU010958 [Platanthera guangdongensis]|uniref:Sec13-like protein n=1 Tax=Platanthera guangdongensis TaxID=2320717 RepID=A0ABR2LI18_9ASPA